MSSPELYGNMKAMVLDFFRSYEDAVRLRDAQQLLRTRTSDAKHDIRTPALRCEAWRTELGWGRDMANDRFVQYATTFVLAFSRLEMQVDEVLVDVEQHRASAYVLGCAVLHGPTEDSAQMAFYVPQTWTFYFHPDGRSICQSAESFDTAEMAAIMKAIAQVATLREMEEEEAAEADSSSV